jgi:hypothetical protein
MKPSGRYYLTRKNKKKTLFRERKRDEKERKQGIKTTQTKGA